MGGLRWIIPVTFLTYTIGKTNFSGIPFFFSGGWTKEEILHGTAHWPVSALPHCLMLVRVILTALYMTRQMLYGFFGSALVTLRPEPRIMTMPLLVLALFNRFCPGTHACVALAPRLFRGRTGSR